MGVVVPRDPLLKFVEITTGCRPVAMGWHGVASATPGQQDASILPHMGILLQFFIVDSSL